jgi:hypothetical protein
MRWSDIPFTPSAATLRWFAGLLAVFLAALGGWQFVAHDHRVVGLVLLGAALVIAPLGLLFPAAVRPIFVAWMVLVYPVGWVTSHLLLACIFYCVFAPVGLLFRLAGRDALGRRFRPDQDTYWVDKPAAEDVRSYFRQS